MRNVRLLLALTACAVLLPSVAVAAGTPKQVLGTVRYSNGTVPQITGEVTFTAYITTRPGETLTETSIGCGSEYYAPDYWCWVECGNFPTPWAVGETLRIDFILDGTSNGGVAEAMSIDVVLDASGSQQWVWPPVELMSFTGTGGPGTVELRWATATETDNLGFWLWRSPSANGEYARVNSDLIEGAGTSSLPREYRYVDAGLHPGIYWYKLEDVAVDGDTELHGPISVTVLPAVASLLTCSPNPVRGAALLQFTVPLLAPSSVRIYSASGHLVATLLEEILEPGSHVCEWHSEAVASGMYYCTLEAGSARESRRIVVVR
jgi:hypothetical protein